MGARIRTLLADGSTWALLVFALLVLAPLAFVFAGSFFPEGALSTAAWRNVLATETERLQLVHSLLLGLAAAAFAVVLGAGAAWVTVRTDLWGARLLGPLGLLCLLYPPIVTAMAFADLTPAKGLPAVALVLAASHAPFCLALTARGLRSIDGRYYEAALLARGRLRAELLLLRQVLPDILAGALLVYVFVLSNHGVPEFFSVKQKTWYVYSEAVFLRWSAPGKPGSLRAAEAVASSGPLIALTVLMLALCLRARRRGTLVTLGATFRPLPRRRLGRWRGPALLLALAGPALGLFLPTWRMLLWSAGATANFGLSWETALASFRRVVVELHGDFLRTLALAAAAALLACALALPLGRRAAASRRPWLEALGLAPLAVPGILLGIALVRLWNDPRTPLAALYESPALVVCGYAARFVPLAILALANAHRRLPPAFDEAARLAGAGAWRRFARVRLPLVLPALGSAWILIYILALRELDLAVVLPPGNDMVARRLANIVHFGNEDVGGALAVLLCCAAALPILVRILVTGRAGEAAT